MKGGKIMSKNVNETDANFEQALAELSSEVLIISVDFTELLEKISAAEKAKVAAKAKYELSLDKGLEGEMSNCLRTIRRLNGEIENLKVQLREFPEKVAGLYEAQHALVNKARALRKPAEEALAEAKRNVEDTEKLIARCGTSLLGDINSLNDRITAQRSSSGD